MVVILRLLKLMAALRPVLGALILIIVIIVVLSDETAKYYLSTEVLGVVEQVIPRDLHRNEWDAENGQGKVRVW